MTCNDVRTALTAYLDGELEGGAADRGSAIRGHIRGCAACHQLAEDEAALRDGLRALPPLEPPASLWAGVQRELAAAEVRDAERPAWRRVFARLAARWAPLGPQLALGSAALAVTVGVLAWRYHDRETVGDGPNGTTGALATQQPPAAHAPDTSHERPSPPPPATAQPPVEGDVTAELADDAAQAGRRYAEHAAELKELALSARAQWPDDRKQVFDAKLAQLERQVAAETDGRPRQRAYRAMIRYLQGVAIRDEVAANEPAFAGRAP